MGPYKGHGADARTDPARRGRRAIRPERRARERNRRKAARQAWKKSRKADRNRRLPLLYASLRVRVAFQSTPPASAGPAPPT